MKSELNSPASAINRVSITDAVVDYIKKQIEVGVYPAGEKLPTEAGLCRMFGVSRTSVREATRVLQTLGYITLIPGKGAFVAQGRTPYMSPDNLYNVENAKFRDFMEVRMAIETLAVRLAVERATQQQIRELGQIHESFQQASKTQDRLQLIILDEQFHTRIIECTNNPLLINTNKHLLDAFRIYRSSSFVDNRVYKNAVIPHSRILLCFQIHDVNQAIEEMRNHLEVTTHDMEIIQSAQHSD